MSNFWQLSTAAEKKEKNMGKIEKIINTKKRVLLPCIICRNGRGGPLQWLGTFSQPKLVRLLWHCFTQHVFIHCVSPSPREILESVISIPAEVKYIFSYFFPVNSGLPMKGSLILAFSIIAFTSSGARKG
jgi:hypothetical protein